MLPGGCVSPRSTQSSTAASFSTQAARHSPGPAAISSSPAMSAVAETGEQLRGLEQRQPNHVGIGAGHPVDQRRRTALDRVTAGLAAPFAGREIGRHFGLAQPLEPDLADNAADR